jgi:hypothetical protein
VKYHSKTPLNNEHTLKEMKDRNAKQVVLGVVLLEGGE